MGSPGQYVNLNIIVLTLLWIVLGLIAYWARKSKRQPGFRYVAVYALAGPLVLPLMAWDYIQAGNAVRLEQERRRKARAERSVNGSAGSAPKSARAVKVQSRKQSRGRH